MRKVTIGEITENLDNRRKPLNNQARAKISKEKLYPYYGANNVMDYVDEYIFDEEILCIAEDGGSWGLKERCSYIVKEKCWINNHAHVLKVKSGNNIKYLYYYLNYNDLNKYITGSTRGKLTKSALNNIEIFLPEEFEQNKIVEVLDKVQSLIYKKKEQIELLDQLVKSRFVEMFGDPVSNKKEWEKCVLKKITSKIGSGSTPKGGNSSYKEEGISLIRSMNVHNNKFLEKDLAFIDDEQADKLKNVIIEENDILLNITGASVARCCIVPNKCIPARVNQHVAILRCKSEEINYIFLSYQLTSDSYQSLLWNIATSNGATREAITKSQIENLEVILPPMELQNEFAEFVTKIDEIKSKMEASLSELEDNFNSLMQKAFKGELF